MIERIVVKLGGSLLHQSTWLNDFAIGWMDAYHQGAIDRGGGELVEGMRLLSSQHVLAEKAMHWRCVRALDLTWEIAANYCPKHTPSILQLCLLWTMSIRIDPIWLSCELRLFMTSPCMRGNVSSACLHKIGRQPPTPSPYCSVRRCKRIESYSSSRVVFRVSSHLLRRLNKDHRSSSPPDPEPRSKV